MSVLEVIGVFVVIPAVIYAAFAVFTVGVGHAKRRVHYRPGQPWEYPDQLWAGDTTVIAAAPADRVGTRTGGARGTW